mmetsp:Transcript_43677/g.61385  ORF Transcript_43677/g.61385 Transcript_43677/m.61385 type:complete len:409 (-) Transcript_43677:19-1245(-)
MVSCSIAPCSASADIECNTFTRPLCKRCCLVYQKFSGCDPCSKRSHRVNSITRYDIPTEDQHRQTWVAQEICELLKTTRDQVAQQVAPQSEDVAQMVESQRVLLREFEDPDPLADCHASTSSSSSGSSFLEPLPEFGSQRERVLRSRLSSNIRSNADVRAQASQRFTGAFEELFGSSPGRAQEAPRRYEVPSGYHLSPDPVPRRVPQPLEVSSRYQRLADPLVPALMRQQQPADYSPLIMGLDGRLKRKYSEVPEFMDPPAHQAKSRLLWSVSAVQELSALVSEATKNRGLDGRDKGIASEVLTIADRYIRIALSIEPMRGLVDPAFAEFLMDLKSEMARKPKVWASHEEESISRRHDFAELGQWIHHYVGGMKEADIFKIKKAKRETTSSSGVRRDINSIQGKQQWR